MSVKNTVATLEARVTELEAALATATARVTDLEAANNELRDELAAHNRPKQPRSVLPTWNGHSATSLVRSMALMGSGPGAINRVMVGLGIVASPATITTQRQAALKGGKEGAKLTPEQDAELRALLARIPTVAGE